MPVDRIAYFEQYLTQKQGDDFAEYALAMEYRKAERFEEALTLYGALTRRNPDYIPGYHQWGILLHDLDRDEEANQILATGIETANRLSNTHARDEMVQLLEDIEAGL